MTLLHLYFVVGFLTKLSSSISVTSFIPPPVTFTQNLYILGNKPESSIPRFIYSADWNSSEVPLQDSSRVDSFMKFIQKVFTNPSLIRYEGGYNFIYPIEFISYDSESTNNSKSNGQSVVPLVLKLPRKDNKIFRTPRLPTNLPYLLLQEEARQIMVLQNHSHIIHLHSIVSSKEDTMVQPIGIIYEACLMNLFQFLKIRAGSNDAWFTRLNIFREIIDAISYGHSRGIIHGDIKLENILLCPPSPREPYSISPPTSDSDSIRNLFVNGTEVIIKVADYFSVPKNNAGYSLPYYSAGYRAPELIESTNNNSIRTLSTKSTISTDIFALGMVMYKLFLKDISNTGMLLTDDEMDIDTAIKYHYRPSLEPHNFLVDTPLQILDIIKQCWETIPSSRPSSAQHLLNELSIY